MSQIQNLLMILVEFADLLNMGEPRPGAPDLFTYHDYRQFLKDWLEYQRRKDENFSLREWAKKLDVSPSYFSHLFTGRRNLSTATAEKICQQIGLDSTAQNFFMNLMKLSDAPNLGGKKTAYQQLKKTSRYGKNSILQLDHNSHEYLSHWFYVAIREMASLSDFQLEAEWIQSRLKHKVSLGEIRQAVRFLLKNGFIILNKAGKPEIQQQEIQCHSEIFSLARAEFHEQVMALGTQAIYETERQHRKHLSTTVALTPEVFEKVRGILDQAYQQIQALVDKQSPDGKSKEVFQISSVAFPMTESTSQKKTVKGSKKEPAK